MNQRNKKIVRTIAFATGLLFTGACTKSLHKAPNPNFDPLPREVSQSVSSQADPMLAQQWSVKKLGLTQVWGQGASTGSRKVKIAVVGTGVDYNHQDLRANILVNPQESQLDDPGMARPQNGRDDDQNGYVDDLVGWDVVDEDGLPFDQIGLGTAAAGVIGAVHQNGRGVRGVNSEISMVPVRYIGKNGMAIVPNLIKALKYTLAAKVDVVYLHMANVAFGWQISSRFGSGMKEAIAKTEENGLRTVLKALEKADIPVVVSAGNSARNVTTTKSVLQVFSTFKNTLIVTAVDQADVQTFPANVGMQVVDTAAPGEGILSTAPGDRYEEFDGTFIAAAHAAGAVALAVSQHFGRYTSEELIDVLLDERGSDLLPAMKFLTVGGNRLNIAKFLQQLN